MKISCCKNIYGCMLTWWVLLIPITERAIPAVFIWLFLFSPLLFFSDSHIAVFDCCTGTPTIVEYATGMAECMWWSFWECPLYYPPPTSSPYLPSSSLTVWFLSATRTIRPRTAKKMRTTLPALQSTESSYFTYAPLPPLLLLDITVLQ